MWIHTTKNELSHFYGLISEKRKIVRLISNLIIERTRKTERVQSLVQALQFNRLSIKVKPEAEVVYKIQFIAA